MSPSIVFWMDSLAGLIGGLIALALLLLVLAAGLRQQLNRVFGGFLLVVALIGLGSVAADATLWISSRVLSQGEEFGNPMLWMELAAIGFYLVGPTLLAFSVSYVRAASLSESDRAGEPFNPRLYRVLIVVGFVILLAVLPFVFNHQLVTDIELDQDDLRRWKLSLPGYVLSGFAFLFELLALHLFWQNRRRLGELKLAAGTALVLGGGIVGGIVRPPFPVFNVCLAVSALTFGYAVADRQILRPLRTMTESLEVTVDERTRELQLATNKLQRLNEQYRRVAEIGQEVARIATRQRQPERAMAERLVQLVHDGLGYHHVYVYRPDAANQYLTIQAAAGSSAEAALLRKHRLQIGGRSLAGQAAAQHRTRMAEAAADDAVYFGDTALPGARSEMALPLLVGGRLLGVLDLQSINYGAFSEEDLSLMVNLADQFAAVLDNARLLQETETALLEVEEIQRQYLRHAWESMVGRGESASAYLYTRGDGVEAADLEAVWSPEIARVAEQTQAQTDDAEETLALPITLRGQLIGALHLRHRAGRTWQAEDVEALSEVSQRLGLALETVRLSEESRRLAARERVIRQISDQMQRATDMQELLRVTTEELNETLNASRVYVRLGTEAELTGASAHELDEKG